MLARLRHIAAATIVGALVLGAALVAGGPARAANPYEVTGVPVDVTAADAATARDQAIVQGQRKAFGMLMEQLVGADKAATIQTPSDAALANMVQDFEVESERLSSVRYIGVMTFRFDADSVNALIGRPSDNGVDVSGGAGAVGATPGTPEVVPTGPTQMLSVSVPIASLRDWVEVRRRLAGIPVVQRAEVRTLARTEGELNLVFVGDPTQLAQALAQRQLSLSQDAQQWTLRLAENGAQ